MKINYTLILTIFLILMQYATSSFRFNRGGKTKIKNIYEENLSIYNINLNQLVKWYQ